MGGLFGGGGGGGGWGLGGGPMIEILSSLHSLPS